jgi:uncharacterized coiled-coil protein SlyX
MDRFDLFDELIGESTHTAKDMLDLFETRDPIKKLEMAFLKQESVLAELKKKILKVQKDAEVACDQLYLKSLKENDEEKIEDLKTSSLKRKAIEDCLQGNKSYLADLDKYEDLNLKLRILKVEIEYQKRYFKTHFNMIKSDIERSHRMYEDLNAIRREAGIRGEDISINITDLSELFDVSKKTQKSESIDTSSDLYI